MNKDKQDQPWWQPGLTLFLQLSGWIAGPIIIAVFLGHWLDERYNTSPWLFLLSVGIAFIISNVGIVKQSLKSMKEMESKHILNKKNKGGLPDEDK